MYYTTTRSEYARTGKYTTPTTHSELVESSPAVTAGGVVAVGSAVSWAGCPRCGPYMVSALVTVLGRHLQWPVHTGHHVLVACRMARCAPPRGASWPVPDPGRHGLCPYGHAHDGRERYALLVS